LIVLVDFLSRTCWREKNSHSSNAYLPASSKAMPANRSARSFVRTISALQRNHTRYRLEVPKFPRTSASQNDHQGKKGHHDNGVDNDRLRTHAADNQPEFKWNQTVAVSGPAPVGRRATSPAPPRWVPDYARGDEADTWTPKLVRDVLLDAFRML